MTSSFKVDVSPDMKMYKLLQSQSYSVYSALSEFVDNSVQSYIDHKDTIQKTDKNNTKLKIKISINSKNKEIVILDNALGINRKNFQRAIKMDTNTDHKKTSLSKFGVGMKTAAVWFSSNWKIETSALGSEEKLICEFNLDKLLNTGEKEVSVSCSNENKKSHYTKITIKSSPRIESKQYYEEKVIPHLAETFIKFKDFLSIDVNYDDKTLKKTTEAYFKPSEPLKYPEVDNKGNKKSNKYKIWKKRVMLTYKNKQVKGSFRIMKTGSYSQPGIRLLRNRRVIEGTRINPNRPKILLGTENKYASQRLYGEVHLNDFEVDFMKTKFTDDLTPLYSELKKELQTEYFIDQVNNYRSRKDNKIDSKTEEAKETKKSQEDIIRKTPEGKITKKKRGANNTKIQQSEKINEKLSRLTYKKLSKLYNSLCIISLQEHPDLAYLGSWAFLECLAKYMGKQDDKINFENFYKNKIDNWYKTDKTFKKSLQDTIKDIHTKGNNAKHSHIRSFSDAKQLSNDFSTLENFIIKCIDNILSKQ